MNNIEVTFKEDIEELHHDDFVIVLRNFEKTKLSQSKIASLIRDGTCLLTCWLDTAKIR